MRGCFSKLVLWGFVPVLCLVTAQIGCVAPSVDPDEEITEAEDALDEEIADPDPAGTEDEPSPGGGLDPNPVPWKSSSQSPGDGDEVFEPNPVPWQPPGVWDPKSTSDTRNAPSQDN